MSKIIPRISGTYIDSIFERGDTGNTGQNASLTLKVKVKLVRVEPPGSAATGTVNHGLEHNISIDRWSDADWNTFVQKFRRACVDTWSNKLWLIPQHNRLSRVVGAGRNMTVSPNISCLLDVAMVSSNSHLTCRVINPTGTFSRSSMSRQRQLGHLDIHDVDPKSSGQVPVAHELGHYLGYSHVGGPGNEGNRYCTSATNPVVICNAHSRGDIMGGGTRVEEWHARAWQNRVARHLGDVTRSTQDWNVPQSARDQYVATRHRAIPAVSSPSMGVTA